jgi:RNA polymerase sigma-70 factor (ECF subfamily)
VQVSSSPSYHEAPKAAADEAQLLAGLIRRDRKATEEFVARFSGAVYSYLHRRLWPNVSDVEDCFQQVFLAAWQSLGSYRAEQDLRAWLLGIARHKAQDVYRERLRLTQWDEEEDVAEDGALAVDEVAIRGEVQEKVWEVLNRIPQQYRILLLWRYWDQQTGEEMARQMGKTTKSIERSLARARACFRRAWDEEVARGQA